MDHYHLRRIFTTLHRSAILKGFLVTGTGDLSIGGKDLSVFCCHGGFRRFRFRARVGSDHFGAKGQAMERGSEDSCFGATGVLAALLLGVASFGFAQSIVNGGFEQPGTQGAAPAGWNLAHGTFIQDSQKRQEGQFSGKLDGVNGSATAFQDASVTPGAGYAMTGFWRNGDKTAEFDVVRAELVWLTTPGGAELEAGTAVSSGKVVSDWTPFQLGPAMAPANATGARIKLISTFGVGAFDRLTWQQTSAAVAIPAAPVAAQTPPPAGFVSPGPSTAANQTGVVSPRGAIEWSADVRAAQAVAAQTGKKVLLFVSQATDEQSRYFETVAFVDTAIRAQILQRYVPLKLDTGRDAQLLANLKLTRPGVLIIYDSSGRPVNKIEDRLSLEKLEMELGR